MVGTTAQLIALACHFNGRCRGLTVRKTANGGDQLGDFNGLRYM